MPDGIGGEGVHDGHYATHQKEAFAHIDVGNHHEIEEDLWTPEVTVDGILRARQQLPIHTVDGI